MQTQQFLIDDETIVKPSVQLVGQDGNAFSIMGRVSHAWRRAGRADIAQEYLERAQSGDYNNLLAITMLYIDEEDAWGEEEEEIDDAEENDRWEPIHRW